MKTILTCLVVLVVFVQTNNISAQCPGSNLFVNPSFEGTPQPHVTPPSWVNCQPGQTPDTQPGSWGITLAPSEGNSYIGLAHNPSSNWREGAGQQLATPLVAGLQYSFLIDLANINATGGGIAPGCAECQIWASSSTACDMTELLWSSDSITPYNTWITDTVTFIPTQNYTAILITINSLGCSANPYILVDNIRPLPDTGTHVPPALNISDTSLLRCQGSSVTIGGIATSNCNYYWTGSGLSSTLVNPVVTADSNSVYHVQLIDTTNGCSTSGNVYVSLIVPPAQTICLVTVDSASTHNIITWEKLDKPATDSFYIYREIATNSYSAIGAVHRDSLSEYHDYGANPNFTAYRYKISATDSCNHESVLSPYHNTIHIQYLGSGNLVWNVYGIENQTTPVSTFDVFYDALANGNWQLLGSVPGNQYTATDGAFNQHPNALYRVAANFFYSCTPSRSAASSMSNIISISGTYVTDIVFENSIHLFPNPANTMLFIQCENFYPQLIILYDANGEKISEQKYMPQLDVSALARGIYFIALKNAEVTTRKKFVKM